MNGSDLRQAFVSSATTDPPDYERFKAMWRAAQARAGRLAPIGAFNPADVHQLPTSLTSKIDAIKNSELFRLHYDHFTPPAQFASVTLSDLVAPQWWADADRVTELAAQVPSQGDDDALFDFCFPTGRLERPAVIGSLGNVIEFIGRRRDIGITSPLRIEDYQPDKIRFGFDIASRPNYMFIALLGMQRLILLNGVHHACALIRAGHSRAFCLLKGVLDFSELELPFNDPGIFKQGRLGAPRPPLISDYFAPAIGDDVSVQALNQRVRVLLNYELSAVPEIR